MNPYLRYPLLAVAVFQISCTHITLLGHKSAYDVNAEFSGDPIAPVSLNAGFEGRSFAAVPPKKAVHWTKNFDPNWLPKGDVMSTLLELKIEKVPASGPYGGVPFDYVTSGATGLAAEAAAGANPSAAPALERNGEITEDQTKRAADVTEKIETITNSGDATFGNLDSAR